MLNKYIKICSIHTAQKLRSIKGQILKVLSSDKSLWQTNAHATRLSVPFLLPTYRASQEVSVNERCEPNFCRNGRSEDVSYVKHAAAMLIEEISGIIQQVSPTVTGTSGFWNKNIHFYDNTSQIRVRQRLQN